MSENKLRILLVDDDRIDRMAVERLVREESLPYEITTAGSQAEGLEKLGKGRYDVVMLDYMLGDGTGLEILTKVKDAPVLFVTGSGDEGVAVQAMKMGAYDYLIKDPERRYLAILPEAIMKVVERKKAEDAVRKLSRVVEQTADCVMITDASGIIEYVNPAFERLTGYTFKDAVGRPPSILKSGVHEKEFYHNLWSTILKGEPFRGEVYNKKKCGDIYCSETAISPIKDGMENITHFVATSRDVTLRKKFEDDLRKAKETAEEATMLKDKFVSLVSHDLRSPISSSSQLLKYILSDDGSTLNPNLKIQLEAISKSLVKMMELIEELLNIGRLKTGKIRPERKFLDAHSIVSSLVSVFDAAAKAKGITLVNSIPHGSRIYADLTLFQQVLHNLVSNAIKFCSTGDMIKISIPAGTPSTIAVSDTGVGIEESRMVRLFNYEDKTSTVGTAGEMGSGFGLPLTNEIMKSHGGELRVESEKGKGSVFYAVLPEVKPVALLVDDEPLQRDLVQLMIHGGGIDVMSAEDGLQALELLKIAKPHIVITDLMMPEMDGFELIRSLKAGDETRDIPVIILSSAEQTRVDEALALGADDFITKPARREDILPRIQRLIGFF